MLDKMKQLWEMKRKMDEIKKELDGLELASEDSLVKVTITGSQEVKKVEIKGELAAADKAKLESSLTETVNRAVRESQKAAAQKMSALGGIPGLGA
ncbi:MAG TPA: nucleoid-associated protein, YbaB/EbfC family [Elusimicrobia bacterium]|nr:MAG: nucleoid-associated protein, YbaB/EbfC family [Elusimicrobia bacterium GWA2_64_40]OGR63498.1 MAG: nucleoid-associated protein, YbaB/EbfC family [Elusimicrobia bacterium GWB2_63_16]HAN04724.1 nucleoid-associated protein, YbaB/EbfC family [Elusimicrobiota bacterium]HAU89153.1 nucleoid-associated protein, YbaB/EbfC family [Elusimicrobiota bacterium]